jgi:hypothetical protein
VSWTPFVKLTLSAFVVEGTYPRFMLNEWDAYNEANESQSVRPGELRISEQHN